MTEYIVLILGDADRWWSTMSMSQRQEGYAEYDRFGKTLVEHGHQITGGAELHASSTAKRVLPGGTTITEGPFTETAEQVGGFYAVETDDLDDLLECCKIIAALGDTVEVRPSVSPQDREG